MREVLALLALAAGAMSAYSETFTLLPNDAPALLVGGESNLALMQGVQEIRVFRIITDDSYEPTAEQTKGLMKMDRYYYCRPGSAIIRGKVVTQTLQALKNMNCYGEELMCDFDPAVILRFGTEADHVDMIVCFRCGEMTLQRNGQTISRPFTYGSRVNTFHGEARRAFTADAKAAFSNDPEIAALK